MGARSIIKLTSLAGQIRRYEMRKMNDGLRQLKDSGPRLRNISAMLGNSRDAIRDVLTGLDVMGHPWSLPFELDNVVLEAFVK